MRTRNWTHHDACIDTSCGLARVRNSKDKVKIETTHQWTNLIKRLNMKLSLSLILGWILFPTAGEMLEIDWSGSKASCGCACSGGGCCCSSECGGEHSDGIVQTMMSCRISGWLLHMQRSESFQINAIDNDDEEVFYDKSEVILMCWTVEMTRGLAAVGESSPSPFSFGKQPKGAKAPQNQPKSEICMPLLSTFMLCLCNALHCYLFQ